MTKKKICLENESFAYYSGFGGLEFKKIEYGIEDYMYCVSGVWSGKPEYHKLKIYYQNDDNYYIKLHGIKVPFNDCISM